MHKPRFAAPPDEIDFRASRESDAMLESRDGFPPFGSEALGELGELSVRMVRDEAELREAQALRYRVFHEEMGIDSPCFRSARGIDEDQWDSVCDHLVVIHEGQARFRGGAGVVGTCRFLRPEQAIRSGLGFYTQREFDIESLMTRHEGLRFMELGRSCVLEPWREKRTVELLWHGIWRYVREHGVDVMTGCGSFPGVSPESFAEPLSFLFHRARASREWNASPSEGNGIPMNLIPSASLDAKRAFRSLPPLIKGYLRLGARFATEAVIDRSFGSTDVLIVLPVSSLNPRYVNHFGPEAERLRR